jgi:ribonuclease Z
MINFPRPGRPGFEITVHEIPPRFEGVVLETPSYEVITRPLEHTVPTFGYRFQEKDRPGKFDESRAQELGIPFGPLRGDLVRGRSIVLEDGREVRPEEVVGPPQPGRAVAYCTDTAFCRAAIELARGADLLIHEATYGDELEDMARARKHATIRQAATVAREAGVARFAATHFSTRYDGPLLRQLAAEGREVYPDLLMAKDLMRIPL